MELGCQSVSLACTKHAKTECGGTVIPELGRRGSEIQGYHWATKQA